MIAINFQGSPLPIEQPLDEFVKGDFIGESSPGIGQRRRFAQTNLRWPAQPGCAAAAFFQSGVQPPVFKPTLVFAAELVEMPAIFGGEGSGAGECRAEKDGTQSAEPGKVDAVAGRPASAGQVAPGDQSLLVQQLRGDKPGRSGERRVRGIWRELRRRPGRSGGEHLPPAQTRIVQGVGESERLGSKIAGAEWAWEAGGVEQHSRGS